jgi:hypothetical protein
MTQTLTGALAAVVEVALGHDAKGADGGEHPAFLAVDLVHAIAFSGWPAFTPPRQVQVFREYISRIALLIATTVTGASPAAEVAIPRVAKITLFVANIVPVPHACVARLPSRPLLRHHSRGACLPSMDSRSSRLQPTVGSYRFTSGGVGPPVRSEVRFV